MKINEYVTVFAKNLEELDMLVNEKIKQGYQPFGNQYCEILSEAGIGRPVCQPMVKYSN